MIASLNWLYVKMRPGKALARLISHLFFQGRPVTTRLRWLNLPLSWFLRSLIRLPIRSKASKPIFIVGTGRSGSTILGQVLSIHRHVGFLNEPKLLWHILYPGEDLIGSYTTAPATYRLTEAQATPDVRLAAHRIYAAYLRVIGASRIVDKYPAMVYRSSFLKALFPDVKFLFLVRNGWDTVHSITKWSAANRNDASASHHDWWGVDDRKWRSLVDEIVSLDPELTDIAEQIAVMQDEAGKAAVEWVMAMREGLRLMQTYPDNSLMVRFEDLVACPGSHLRDVLQFCDLELDPVMLQYASQTLHPVPTKGPLPLPDMLVPIFLETMAALGYSAETEQS